MKHLSSAILAAVLLAPVAAHAQSPAACKLTTIDVPVAMEGLRPMVSAKVSGEAVKLLLDSGAFFSHLDSAFVAKVKLKPVPVLATGSLIPGAGATLTSGAAGRVNETGVVIAPLFEFAGGKFTNVQFLSSSALRDADGLLGQNVLHQLDNEYDFRNGKLKLIKAQGCQAVNLAYWAKPGTTYSVSDLIRADREDPHTISTITINGVPMRAYFDTGAATSFITARAAARAGVKTTDPGVTPAGLSHAMDRPDIKTWVARFASVKIGDEEIKNTRLSIGESQADDFDVLIGADFFLAHHVYVANSQGKVYFTYEGGPVFRVEDSPEAPAGKKAD